MRGSRGCPRTLAAGSESDCERGFARAAAAAPSRADSCPPTSLDDSSPRSLAFESPRGQPKRTSRKRASGSQIVVPELPPALPCIYRAFMKGWSSANIVTRGEANSVSRCAIFPELSCYPATLSTTCTKPTKRFAQGSGSSPKLTKLLKWWLRRLSNWLRQGRRGDDLYCRGETNAARMLAIEQVRVRSVVLRMSAQSVSRHYRITAPPLLPET
jgi:hypothetical protein